MWMYVSIALLALIAAASVRASILRSFWEDNPKGQLRAYLTDAARKYPDLPDSILIVDTKSGPRVVFPHADFASQSRCEFCGGVYDEKEPLAIEDPDGDSDATYLVNICSSCRRG